MPRLDDPGTACGRQPAPDGAIAFQAGQAVLGTIQRLGHEAVKIGECLVVVRVIDHRRGDAFPFRAPDGVAGVLIEGREQRIVVGQQLDEPGVRRLERGVDAGEACLIEYRGSGAIPLDTGLDSDCDRTIRIGCGAESAYDPLKSRAGIGMVVVEHRPARHVPEGSAKGRASHLRRDERNQLSAVLEHEPAGRRSIELGHGCPFPVMQHVA